MGVTIDFRRAARKLRVIEPGRAALSKVEQIDEIQTRFKLEMRLALSLLNWKMKLLDESMLALDKSRCETAVIEAQIGNLKKMLRIASTAVEAL
jgi:hypothetical protein